MMETTQNKHLLSLKYILLQSFYCRTWVYLHSINATIPKTNNYLLLTTDPDKITDNVALF